MVIHLDPYSLAEYSSQVLSAAGNAELEQRLGLYRVFLKLYEHHRGLLDEILELENSDAKGLPRIASRFAQGVVQGDQTYLLTNLLQEQTQMVRQPQGIWVLGRDRKVALPISDRRLSRRHAAIQYVQGEGFYLVDLNSTNGSFVNGEAVRHARFLQDGDQVRLGSLTFTFFICTRVKVGDDIPPDLVEQIRSLRESGLRPTTEQSLKPEVLIPEIEWDTPLNTSAAETSLFLIPKAPNNAGLADQQLEISPAKQAEILDRFLNR